MGTNTEVRVGSATESSSWLKRRRCINRSCGRYFNKVDELRCDSCRRSTRWAPTAFIFRIAKRLR